MTEGSIKSERKEYNSIKGARTLIENQFKELLVVILDRFEKIFTPFEFEPI